LKSTNAEERVKRDGVMDRFCASRGMLYDPENGLEWCDAILYLEKNGHQIGVARVISQPGKFGNKPVAIAKKEDIDFLNEIAALTGKGSAVIFKFRDKLAYWRVKDLEKISFENSLKCGRSHTVYHVPINFLVPL
jgi:hypothetical protein